MRPFKYLSPSSLEDAVLQLQRQDEKIQIMAGGTDLLVEMKLKMRTPDTLIDIKNIPDLDYLIYDAEKGLRIGALTTIRTIETSPIIKSEYAGLAQAAKEIGSIQIRNRATVVGNICRASPSADTPPPLIANDARVKLIGPEGEREVSLEDFFTGPGETVIAGDEIFTEIAVPSSPPHTGKVYIKHGRRKAMELATVGVAVTLTLDNEICQNIRIVLGAVAPTPIRAQNAESLLQGQVIDEQLIQSAALAAMEESRPIDDVRGSAAYRRKMVKVLTMRALTQALVKARIA